MLFCSRCPLRKYAEAKPNSWLAKFWRWHTGWCPGWKAYVRKQKKNEQSS
jgi:hypothetical protein